MLRERLSVCGRYHIWIYIYSWPYKKNTHSVPHDKLLRYTWGSAYQAFRTVTSVKLFPWINSHGGPSSVGPQFCGTELRGRKPGGLRLQLPMKVPLEPSQLQKINPLCVWLIWPTLAFPLVWEEFCPWSTNVGPTKGNLYKPPCVRTTLAGCWISAGEAAFWPWEEYTEATQEKCFLCALLSYTGNDSLFPAWQVRLWTLTTNARSTRHIVLADHVTSISTLLPHKKVAAVLGLDQASLAIAQCGDLTHH